MIMIYGSVCSGIEAASVAWEPLGWKPAWFSEIAKFPSDVLEQRYKGVCNLRNMENILEKPEIKTHIDLLVGGTPCQSFSQAGYRLGLADPRGNLALVFLKIAKELRPRWIVWENVPGVLSINKGDGFATILQEMVNCGYGVCYRVLDSRYFGLPQNRRRVFVIGYLGDWRPAAAVLFERKTSDNNTEGSRKAQGRIPVCTTRNAGNANARGVVVVESLEGERDSKLKRLESGKGQNLRRLTPAEEERRMGFSGKHTEIPDAADALRYQASGNSMAVPVMRWIGERIQAVENELSKIKGGTMAGQKRTKDEIEKLKNDWLTNKLSPKEFSKKHNMPYATANADIKKWKIGDTSSLALSQESNVPKAAEDRQKPSTRGDDYQKLLQKIEENEKEGIRLLSAKQVLDSLL